MWDPLNADPNIALTWEEQTATQSQRNGIGTVVGIPPAFYHSSSETNKWYFEVFIEKIRGGIFVGVVGKDFKTSRSSNGVGEYLGTWAIDSYTGSVGSNVWKPYAKRKFKPNDVIGVLIDLEADTLSFSINGISYGIAFSIPKEGVYYPAVTLKYRETCITANFGTRKFRHCPPGFLPLTYVDPALLDESARNAAEIEQWNKLNSPLLKPAEEVVQHMMTFLDPLDLLKVSRTCKFLARIANDNAVWKGVFRNQAKIRDESEIGLCDSFVNFKQLSKVRYNMLHGHCARDSEFKCDAKVNCLRFTDKYLVTGTGPKITAWNLIEDEENDVGLFSTFVGHENTVACLQFDSRLLVSGAYDSTVRVWDFETSDELLVLEEHKEEIKCLQYEESFLVTGSGDKTAKLWNMDTGQCTATLPHRKSVKSVCLVYADNLVFTSSESSVFAWDIRTQRQVKTFNEHGAAVTAIQYNKHNNQLISACAGGVIKWMDLKNDMGLYTYNKDKWAVNYLGLKFNLLVCGDQRSVKVFLPDDNNPCQVYTVPPYFSMDFSLSKIRMGHNKRIKVLDFDDFEQQYSYAFKRDTILCRLPDKCK